MSAESEAVDQVLAESEPGAICVKWVLIAEIMEPDGKRRLVRSWSESCELWDVFGLLDAGTDESYWTEDD